MKEIQNNSKVLTETMKHNQQLKFHLCLTAIENYIIVKFIFSYESREID